MTDTTTKQPATIEVDGRFFPRMLPDSRAKRTDELEPGMRVLLVGRHVRTVAAVVPTCWENNKGETILCVSYTEGRTDEWSEGNTGAPGTLWMVEIPAEVEEPALRCAACGRRLVGYERRACSDACAQALELASSRPVQVGDFFYTSWGYDQTNVDFYEVVGITKSGQSVKVREVSQACVSGGDGGPADRVAPLPGAFRGEVMTKRLRPSSYKGWSFRVASYATAWLWDLQPKHQTGAGWGH